MVLELCVPSYMMQKSDKGGSETWLRILWILGKPFNVSAGFLICMVSVATILETETYSHEKSLRMLSV